jgi:DNA-binding IclR family transcriptional regulator
VARSSPPTDRVVGVLNLLAGEDSGLSASAIARRLQMTSSTCATLLAALDGADYVERSPDKTYRLGSGLLPLAQALHGRFPLLGVAHDELSRLCADLRCGATLTRIAGDHLRVLVAVGANGQDPLGVAPGDRFPLSPPYGAIAMAWRPDAEVDQWIDSAPAIMTPTERDHERRVMVDIRARGAGVWTLEPRAAPLVERIRSLIGDLASSPTSQQLRDQVTELFAVFGRHGYTADELASRRSLSVGYVLAAIFGADGQPRYEIDLHVLRATMSGPVLDDALDRVLESAALLTGVIGGEHPASMMPTRGRRTERSRST